MPVQAATHTRNATADTFVDSSSPSGNYGGANELNVRTSATSPNFDTYLKFDVSALPILDNVKLRISAKLVNTSIPLTLTVFAVADTDWQEAVMTWANRPAYGNELVSKDVVSSSSQWYELDVTAYVLGEINAGRTKVSFCFHNTEAWVSEGHRVHSRETPNSPQLVCTPKAPHVWLGFGANAGEPSHIGRIIARAAILVNNAWSPIQEPVTVSYAVDSTQSTATPGTDYQPLSGSVVITPDMLGTGTIEVIPLDDAADEDVGNPDNNERVAIKLVPGTAYTFFGSSDPNYPNYPSTATVIIGDDDPQPPQVTTWYVATDGVDNGNTVGTIGQPFKTLPYAITKAKYGDTIYMRGGVYRDPVNFAALGNGLPTLPLLEESAGSWNRMLSIENYNGEEVIIKGSTTVSGWQHLQAVGNAELWRAAWSMDPNNPDDNYKRVQQMFIDGQLLGHVGWNAPLGVYPWGDASVNQNILLNEPMFKNSAGISVLQQNTAHMTNWSFYHSLAENLLYVLLPLGVNPNVALVEAGTSLTPMHIAYDYVRLKGLKIRHSNTFAVTGTWPGVSLARYCSVENCDIQWCSFIGLSVRDESRIINCLIANNGMTGANTVGTNIVASGNQFLANHFLPFDWRGEAAGAKNIGLPNFFDNCRWENNEFGGNRGQGLWFDGAAVREPSTRPVIVRKNFMHDNTEAGLFLESLKGGHVFNNVSVRNGYSPLNVSGARYCWIFNNTLLSPYGAQIGITVHWRVTLPILGSPNLWEDWMLPHHLWIKNNIFATVQHGTQAHDNQQFVAETQYGNCAGLTDIYFDYNCYLVTGNRPTTLDYFGVQNVDLLASLPGSCSPVGFECVYWWRFGEPDWMLCPPAPNLNPPAWSFRLNWDQWKDFGNDTHGLIIYDPADISSFFVNAAADDYHLAWNNPAVAAGENLYSFLQDDYADMPRPSSGNFSLGAYQFVNHAPTISDISSQPINEDTSTVPLGFVIGDSETPAASLTVSGSSSNPSLVPNANIVFGGSGANRTVTVTPLANQSGSAVITVTVSDGSLPPLTADDVFLLTVNPVNDPPTISNIADRTINQDTTTGVINFTIGDVETAAGSLTLSGSSSNPTLVPNANIVFGGSGANRTVTVTPVSGQSGSSTITVTVSDGSLTANDTFLLTVNATAPTYLFTEGFEGTGFENTGWTKVGSPNENYTATVLHGAQSLNCSGTQRIWRNFQYSTSFNLYFRVRWIAWTDYRSLVFWDNVNWTTTANLYADDNRLLLNHGSVQANGTTIISAGTTYHVWVEWTKGTGANGTMKLFMSTTGTKPGSPEANITTGNGVATERIYVGLTSSGPNVIFDRILVDDVAIGSNP